MKIFLGDLVHNWSGSGIWTIPLNSGFVASYSRKKMLEQDVHTDYSIFKDPKKMFEEIKLHKPDIIGLSFYVWNENLNKHIFDYAKKLNPNVLTVGGGPHFTNINNNLEGAKSFFSEVPNCDIYVINQGEKGFVEVLKKFVEVNKNTDKLKEHKIIGSIVNNSKANKLNSLGICDNHIFVGENIGTLTDLNEIPSPYLNGMLDEFFDGPYMPIIETNRSCPYRCTFCAWGIGTTKLARFNEDRVLEEIEYISTRCNKASTLFIADANFGILERDAQFAAKMFECHKKYGFPQNVDVQWNKTRPDRVLKTAAEFNGIAAVGASMQSINEDVLAAIKRKNLTAPQILQLQEELKKLGVEEKKFTELIIGLPNETKSSHIEANKTMIDYGFEVFNYNLHLLPGTEMDEKNYRKKYFKKTGFRLHDNCWGVYEGKTIFEAQETVLKTNKLSINDFRYFRFYHFIQQMMWSKKWYYDYLMFFKINGIHPVDVFDKIIINLKRRNGPISKLYRNFMHDYNEAESFESMDQLYEYWSKKENFKRLENGEYGKLNMLYTYKIILDNREHFSNFLISIANQISDENNFDSEFISYIKEILHFQNSRFIKIDSEWKIKTDFKETFNLDVLALKKNNFKINKRIVSSKTYKFFLPDTQFKALSTQLEQYKSQNINSALRHMTVTGSTDQFFYHVA